MPSSLDCTLCLMRQSLEAARFASDDTVVHEQVLTKVMELVRERGLRIPPPIIGQEIHREIRALTGSSDPYAQVKKEFNDAMLQRADDLRQRIAESPDPFDAAVRIAIFGNSIDFALNDRLRVHHLDDAIETALAMPINGSVEKFAILVEDAKDILYVADNCGEIVCDMLLIEQIQKQWEGKHKQLTFAVRGKPIINDATREDAEYIGIDRLMPVIDNGNDGLGTILEQASSEFMEHYSRADLVISKGLGNYETLINPAKESQKPFVFLFKAKCTFIAQLSGTTLGDHVISINKSRNEAGTPA